MVRVYLVRHCEAAGNKERVFQGSSDRDISENGAIQLEFLRKRFAEIHIDKVYASPLKRAYKTAFAVAEGKGLPVLLDPGLTEIDGGILEGKTFVDIFTNHNELETAWDERPQDFAPPGGESMRQVYERIWDAFCRIVNDPENEGKTLLIASHGAAIRNLLCRVTLGRIERLREMEWADNTAVSLLIADSQGVRAEYVNDSSHVPAKFMPKRNRIAAKIVEESKA